MSSARYHPIGDDPMDSNDIASSTTPVRRHRTDETAAEGEAEGLLPDERDALEQGPGRSSLSEGTSPSAYQEKRSSRSQRRKDDHPGRRRRKEGADTELLYKVEEGGRSSSAGSSGNSSEAELHNLKQAQAKRKSKVSRFGRFAAVHVVIVLAFLALLYGAYRASRSPRPAEQSKSSLTVQTLSNGTHDFAPTTILISLDGFREDFLYRGLTPTLSSLIQQGVSPDYMHPSFPSLTFPNHFTLMTGLYPESHGIVGNTFFDPSTQKEFYYTDPARSMTPEWWLGEPLWETAELQGIRTAIHMWPGSEAHIGTKEPTYVDKFNADEKLDEKVHRVLDWLDLPGPNDTGALLQTPRPQLIAAYVPNVDADGHSYGPNSTYIRSTIAEVDGMLGMLFTGIEERNLTDIVNIVVVSDHGMATTSNDRLIQLEDLIDPSLIEHTDGWPLYGLRPYDRSAEKLQEIYQALQEKSLSSKYKGRFEVYLRDENMPERFHFSKSQRIAPLWIVPKAGWAIVTKSEFNVEVALKQNLVYHPRGLHGYDHEHPLMRAIFVARGPAFPHPKGSQVDNFQNTEVYNIVCDSLGLEPRPNNGTIRLPFKPIGMHDVLVTGEVPEDLASEDTGVQILPPMFPGLPNMPSMPASAVQTDAPAQPDAPTQPDAPPETSRPVVNDGGSNDNGGHPGWLKWIHDKFKGVQAWTSHLFGGSNANATATRH